MTTYASAKAALQAVLVSGQPAGAIYPERLASAIVGITDVLDSDDRYVTGLASYDTSTDTLVLNLSDGSTVDIPMSALIADAVADRVPTSRTVSTESGLTGGGDLSANRTIALDINALTEDATPDAANDFVLIYDVSGTAHKKAKPSNLVGSGVAWGGITGSLASQTDLNAALGGKASTGANTFSGDQEITKASPAVSLNKAASGQAAAVHGKVAGVARWLMYLGDDLAESGANAGSRFILHRYADNGAYLGSPFHIERDTGHVYVEGFRSLNNSTFDTLIPRLGGASQAISGLDLNTVATLNGWYTGFGCTNAPTGGTDWYIYAVVQLNASWILQIAYEHVQGTKIWRRYYNNGTWTSWENITPGQSPVKAWVNFNGTGTPSIRASSNVSSITDHGTGNYTVNFTSALADANYVVVGTAMHDDATGTLPRFGVVTEDLSNDTTFASKTTTACRIDVRDGGGLFDAFTVNVAFLR